MSAQQPCVVRLGSRACRNCGSANLSHASTKGGEGNICNDCGKFRFNGPDATLRCTKRGEPDGWFVTRVVGKKVQSVRTKVVLDADEMRELVAKGGHARAFYFGLEVDP